MEDELNSSKRMTANKYKDEYISISKQLPMAHRILPGGKVAILSGESLALIDDAKKKLLENIQHLDHEDLIQLTRERDSDIVDVASKTLIKGKK